MKTGMRPVLWLAAVLSLACSAAPSFAGRLENAFASPPASARPWVYWFCTFTAAWCLAGNSVNSK